MAAPTAFGPRKECEALETLGDVSGAVVACREVLTRPGVVVEDYTHFVDLVLENRKPLPELEPKELENVIAHLEKERLRQATWPRSCAARSPCASRIAEASRDAAPP